MAIPPWSAPKVRVESCASISASRKKRSSRSSGMSSSGSSTRTIWPSFTRTRPEAEEKAASTNLSSAAQKADQAPAEPCERAGATAGAAPQSNGLSVGRGVAPASCLRPAFRSATLLPSCEEYGFSTAPAFLGATGFAPASLSLASRRGCGSPSASGVLTAGLDVLFGRAMANLRVWIGRRGAHAYLARCDMSAVGAHHHFDAAILLVAEFPV